MGGSPASPIEPALGRPAMPAPADIRCGRATNTGITTYGVPTGGGGSCTTICLDTTTAKSYIIVTAHVCYQPIFSWPGLNYCTAGNSICTGCSTQQLSLSSQSVVLKQ